MLNPIVDTVLAFAIRTLAGIFLFTAMCGIVSIPISLVDIVKGVRNRTLRKTLDEWTQIWTGCGITLLLTGIPAVGLAYYTNFERQWPY